MRVLSIVYQTLINILCLSDKTYYYLHEKTNIIMIKIIMKLIIPFIFILWYF